MNRKHWVEALFSFFIIGSGQVLKGDGEKGLKLILITYFVIPIAIYLSLAINGLLFLTVMGIAIIFLILLWIYNIWDALTYEAIV